MLDIGMHQAAGLSGFAPHAHLRVVAVAASPDGAASALEMLWEVCASLQRLGYPVVVLDGTAQESEHSPGLVHLMQQDHWGDAAALAPGARSSTASLAVLPAARGMALLARAADRTGAAPLTRLLPSLRTYGIVVLHAGAATLAPLLTHTATVPLVVMGSGAAGLLASYQSLKQIALDTGLPCMVAALLRADSASERRKSQAALAKLQDCAQRHLGGPVRTTTIAARSSQDLQRLALQLLENAGTIDDAVAALPASALAAAVPAHLARSH